MLEDYRTAPIHEKLRVMLGLLETFTLHPEQLDASSVRAVLDAGVTRDAIREYPEGSGRAIPLLMAGPRNGQVG